MHARMRVGLGDDQQMMLAHILLQAAALLRVHIAQAAEHADFGIAQNAKAAFRQHLDDGQLAAFLHQIDIAIAQIGEIIVVQPAHEIADFLGIFRGGFLVFRRRGLIDALRPCARAFSANLRPPRAHPTRTPRISASMSLSRAGSRQ